MKHFQRLVFLLSLVAAFGGWTVAAAENLPPRVDPSINAPYLDPDFESWQRTFEQPGREVYDKRQIILEASGVTPGMAVADIGAGTGLFTLLFAQEVGDKGRVYAVDISATFVDNVLRRARTNGLQNVEGIVNEQKTAGLPPDSVDLAFICDTYHHFEYPELMMESVHRALRPGGTLVVIDFRKEGGSRWVQRHVRANRLTVIEEISAAGFELLEDADFLQRNYFLRFRKPAD